jgi:hypothetical protein
VCTGAGQSTGVPARVCVRGCAEGIRARARARERERALIFMSQRHSDKNTGALVQTVTLRVSFRATPYRSRTGSHDTPARDQVASPERRGIPRKRTGKTDPRPSLLQTASRANSFSRYGLIIMHLESGRCDRLKRLSGPAAHLECQRGQQDWKAGRNREE